MAPLIGSFVLGELMARGAHGAVHRGRHAVLGTPVAIKLLAKESLKHGNRRRTLRDEVLTAAALDHRGVILVLDAGLVPDETGLGDLAGTPYLVMELASGGNLRELGAHAPLPWKIVRHVLLSLLEALGHTHAHGFVHRDVKPDNVVLCTVEDLRPGPKLTDFGLRWSTRGGGGIGVAGTPQYMAPEQAAGETDQFGPWTDLYALAVLAWELVSGQPTRTPDPSQLRSAVPDGFLEWVQKGLSPDPDARWRRAMEAGVALAGLAEGTLTGVEAEPAVEAWTAGELAHGRTTGAFPLTWRPLHAWPVPDLLVGAGSGMFGPRKVPFVGREEACDAVWRTLRQVHEERRAHALVVEGPRNVGLTRFAEHMASRAHELVSAQVIGVRHAISQPALEALGAGLSEHLPGSGSVPGNEGALVERLARLAEKRTLVLVLDDVDHAPEVLEIVEALLLAQGSTPGRVLVLCCTHGDEASRQLRAQLLLHPAASHLELKPMSDRESTQLVRRMLPLENTVAAQVEALGHGLPGVMRAVLRDALQRRTLQAGVSGYALEEGEALRVPGSEHETDPLRGLPDGVLRALEILAATRDGTTWREWVILVGDSTACKEGIQRLRSVGAVDEPDDRVAITRPGLVGALRAHAVRKDRLRDHHLAWSRIQGADGMGLFLAGHHLFQAGRPMDAVPSLYQGYRELTNEAHYRKAVLAVEELDEALRAARVAESDRWWARLWIAEGLLARLRGRLDEALARFQHAELACRRHGWRDELGDALRGLGATYVLMERYRDGERVALEAVRLCRGPNLGDAYQVMARSAAGQNDPDRALVFHRKALRMMRSVPSKVGTIDALIGVGTILLKLCDYEGARDALEEAVRLGGHTRMASEALNNLAEIDRFEGRLQAARDRYEQAAAIHERVTGAVDVVARLNLALIAITEDDHREASAQLEPALAALQLSRQPRTLFYARAVQMAPLARRRAWSALEERLNEVEDDSAMSHLLDEDIGLVAKKAAEWAMERPDLATRLGALAARLGV